MKIITYDQSGCDNCGACQIVCSLAKKGEFAPNESRIHIETTDGLESMRAVVCQHCAEPVCVTACMRGIIDKDPASGKVSRRSEGCFRCAACQVMCPIGAAVMDSDINAFVTCDLCDDNPLCVKVCKSGALRYEDTSAVSDERRNKYAQQFHEKSDECISNKDGADNWDNVKSVIDNNLGIKVTVEQLKTWSSMLKEANKEGE